MHLIEALKIKYKIQQLVVVANAVLMCNKNINDHINKQYVIIKYERIKNETQQLQAEILSTKVEVR